MDDYAQNLLLKKEDEHEVLTHNNKVIGYKIPKRGDDNRQEFREIKMNIELAV